MTEVLPTVEDTPNNPTLHRQFPALAQFAVLVVLLGTLLGGAILPVLLGITKPTPALVNEATATPRALTTMPIATFTAPPLKAKAVFVYDVMQNNVIYERNADVALPLASITKLMTTLVAKEILDPKATVPVSKSAATQASASGLLWGENLTSESLRDFALLASANDAAFALAEGAGAELSKDASYEAFIAAMNITAKELNLPTLRFLNATGLDVSATEAGAYGSARDVSLLMSYLLKNYPDLLFATTQSSERVYNIDGAYHEAENTNPTIQKIPNLLGSKTGYTDLAAGNLTIAFDAGYNRPVVITVLGSTYDERFTDTLALVAAVREALNGTGNY